MIKTWADLYKPFFFKRYTWSSLSLITFHKNILLSFLNLIKIILQIFHMTCFYSLKIEYYVSIFF